jgi:protein gp37
MDVFAEDKRVLYGVDDLRRVAAVVRFLSCEPLIGTVAGIDLKRVHW